MADTVNQADLAPVWFGRSFRSGMKSMFVSVSVLALSVAAGGGALAADGPTSNCGEPGLGEKTATLIQARYEGIRDIRADFTQENQSASFAGEPLMSSEPKTGKVSFAKPGKMHWSYVEPEKSIVVSNGATLWIYDVDGKSVTRLEVTAGFLSGAALQFLLGDGQILETFDVSATECSADQVVLDLLPKQDATYERLGLVADRESGDIVGTSVKDLFGNLTVIRFQNLQVNQAPADSVFELSIPDGVELIDYAAGATGAAE
ncbi:MAG: outer membrane lipoprotein carrier protein LolA [Myxococcota bacterium]